MIGFQIEALFGCITRLHSDAGMTETDEEAAHWYSICKNFLSMNYKQHINFVNQNDTRTFPIFHRDNFKRSEGLLCSYTHSYVAS